MKLNRNMINEMINTFCKITTVIFIACCLRSGFFTRTEEFYSVFDVLSILSIALISVLLTLPFYSQKERSRPQVRKPAIQEWYPKVDST